MLEVNKEAATGVVPVMTEVVVTEPAIAVKTNTPTIAVKKEAVPVEKAAALVVVPDEKEKNAIYSIEGSYLIDIWGECIISKKADGYAIIGGDENYEFATISKTSKSTIFMVKKTGFSQSQLLELTEDGNLKIDTENGVKIFKRVK